jgi:hypothetical protein
MMTLKSDIFSIGSVFYGMVAGQPLIPGIDVNILLIENKEIGDKINSIID